MSGYKKKWYLVPIILIAIVFVWHLGGFCAETDTLNAFINDTGAGDKVIDADPVNENFSLITGNVYPRNTAGLRIGSTYDLGSTVYPWDRLYSDNATIGDVLVSGYLTGETVSLMFQLPSTAFVGTKIDSVLMEVPMTITGFYAYSDASPEVTPIIIDVNKNGTTLFTTQTNRVTVATREYSGVGTVEVSAVAIGDRISWDIDQTGVSTIEAGGNYLMLTIKGRKL